MGRRILEVTAELLVNSFTKGLVAGPPRFFYVSKDPIPDDATIVGVRNSPYHPCVEILLESKAWPESAECEYVEPWLSCVSFTDEQWVKIKEDTGIQTVPGSTC